MPPDHTTHLITAARQRHELTRAKAIRAIRQLARTGTPITFGSVARTATVSRSCPPDTLRVRVTDTVHDANPQVTSLRAGRTQDNHRVGQRPTSTRSEPAGTSRPSRPR
jgi:hypothetical protein